ncbi:MAG: MoaD family protein [Candidatus Bathyarchaeia archaeon]
MAKVHVRFLTRFKEVTGKDSADVNIDKNSTVDDLLKQLCSLFGESFCSLVFRRNGSIAENLVIFVNGKNILTLDGAKTKLADGDYLILSTPVAGG